MSKKLHKFRLLLCMFLAVLYLPAKAQTTIATGYAATTNSGTGFAITFVIANTSGADILLTDVANWTEPAHNGTTSTLYYSSTSLSGTPGTFTPPTWTSIASNTLSGITTTGVNPVLTGMTFLIPNNTTYRFALFTTGTNWYASSGATNTFTSGGVNLHVGNYQIAGANVGYGGPNNPRYFAGSITFAPAAPCTAPPTAGTSNASNTNPCMGQNVTFSLTGSSFGTGQTYQWETSATIGGPYTPVAGATSATSIFPVSTTGYYRAAVTCSGNTTYSTPVLITVPAAFPAGNYTINSAVVTGGTNFQTFSDAIAAISCGISGPVVFDVAIGSGPYVEQVTIPSTVGSSSTNTVTVNGNGAVLSFAGTAAAPHTFGLNGADYITVNNLNIEGTDATYALVCHLWNDADNNNFNNCTFTAPANSTATTTVPFCLNGSATTALTTGLSGNNNIVTGCTMNSGYYNTVFYGNSSGGNTGNQLINCNLKDFYFYGAMSYYQNGIIIRGNTIERPARTTLSTFYGVYILTGTTNALVENNRIRNPFMADPSSTSTAYGVYSSVDAAAGTENKYINNLISDFEGSGTHAGLYLTGADYLHAYHNTIAFNYSAATAGTTYGIYSTGSVGGIDIKNNNISITRGGTGTKYCLYFTNGFQTSDNNNLYMNAPAGTNYTGYFSTGQTLLSDWQLVNGGVWDAASVAVDPLFINPAAGDYTPGNSLMDDLGTPVGVTTDINGAPRSATTPDIGAYEFSVPPCVGFPTPGTATAQSGICPGELVNLSLTGFTVGAGITVQWESYDPGTLTWMPISGATTPSYAVSGQTIATDYRAVVTCANGGFSDVSNIVSVPMNSFILCYCTSSATSALYEEIFNVSVGLLNNTSDCATGNQMYSDYTALTPANLPQSTATPFSLTLGTCGTTSTAIAIVYIDYNQNGLFTDAGEEVFVSTPAVSAGAPGTIVTGNIVVPATASLGLTGMRVVYERTTLPANVSSCGTYTYGETEDYWVNIVPPPTCLSPGTPAVTNITATGADASWTASVSAPANGYEWVVFPSGSGPYGTPVDAGVTAAGVTTASFSGLAPTTSYVFYVRAHCSATDSSTWVSATFVTPCAAFPAPYTHDVEAQVANTNSTMNSCWSSTPSGTASVYAWHVTGTGTTSSTNTGPSSAHSGSKYFFTEASYGALNAVAELITPVIDVSTLTLPMLEFYYHMWGPDMNKLVISIGNGTTWTPVDSLVGQQQAAESDPWLQRTVILAGYTGNIQVKFTGIRGNGFGGDISIDDISVIEAPTCVPPTGITAANITTSSADISWTTPPTAASGYEWAIDQTSTLAPDAATLINTTTGTGPVPATGLTAGTRYYVHLRTDCGTVNGVSNWAVYSFATRPVNDTCLNAINISGGQPTPGTTVGATQDMPSGTCAATTTYANDVWYYFNTGLVGDVTVTATNTVGDVVMEVYSGACGTLVSLDCQDSPAIGTETTTLLALPVGTYYVRIYGFLSIENPFIVQVTGTPLSIKLHDITARNVGSRNRIDWNTLSENTGDGFILQRSADGRDFSDLTSMDAKGTASTYTYWDEQPLSGLNYYRLKMTDAGGAFEYSKVVTATVSGKNVFGVNAYPNPVKDELSIEISGGSDNGAVVLTDVTGKVIRSVKVVSGTATLPMSDLAQGMYLLNYSDDHHSETIKVNKQ